MTHDQHRKQILANLAWNCHQLRLKKGLTIQALADKAGVSYYCIHSLENQLYTVSPQLNTVMQIAEALGTPLSTFLFFPVPEYKFFQITEHKKPEPKALVLHHPEGAEATPEVEAPTHLPQMQASPE